MKWTKTLLVALPLVQGFLSPQPRALSTSTSLEGIFGRFRKTREVEQPPTIAVGNLIPDQDVEELVAKSDADVELTTRNIKEVLGSGKSLLVGMPGAFTPTCTKEHLPGYIKNAEKLRSLGVEKIAVLTTNDRFVNEEWMASTGCLNPECGVTVVCDGDGDLVKNMGLAEDMGFGVGVRSMRFALIADDGQVSTLLTDEGMDECSSTSAETVIELLNPEIEADENQIDVNALGLGAAAVAAFVIGTQVIGGGSPSSELPARTFSSQKVIESQTVRPTTSRSDRASETSFSLINDYLK